MGLPPLSYNLRSLWVRRSSTLLTVVSIGATVAVLAGILALEQGFRSLYELGGRDDVVSAQLRIDSSRQALSLKALHRFIERQFRLSQVTINTVIAPICRFHLGQFK